LSRDVWKARNWSSAHHANGDILQWLPRGILAAEYEQMARKAELPCGASVTRNERFKWLSRITGDPRLLPMDKALAARLVLYYLNRKGEAYPAHDTLANGLSVSVSSVKRSIVKLQRAGLLRVISGRKRGRSNCYSLSWPNDPGSNVVRILRGGNQ
jgi:hypothetical protein